ncbi:disease resistance protein RPM1-like [Lycium barbarum]|uniref:disease resistance protein RPM1-like n=1 Tax=Lycium barbarum TaxID=112863 RepID=UPI00293EAF75|nr:disease resistance protein RPM1-like [Lycium barbarum]
MAESAVNILIKSIEFLLKHPGSVIGGVRHEISHVKLELESIASFIIDAGKCKQQNESLNVWVVQVRDVAFEAEDIIDEFLYHVDSMKKGGFSGRIFGVFYLPKVLWLRNKTALELRRIRGEIKDIAKRSKRYDLSHMEGSLGVGSNSHHSAGSVQNIGESSLFIENDEVVGIDEVRDSLVSSLEGEEAHRVVISVAGMGGSGKTTLVAKAYTSLTVKKNFDCSAWVSVSQNNMIEDLLRKLISEFFNGKEDMVPKNLESMDYRQLVETLVKFLHKKRYVVVFDDVWNNNFWRQISVALPDDKNRSRIIITTRNEDIAAFPYGPGGNHVFRLKPLADDYAWRLFCNKAFSSQPNCQCPPELEKIGRELVKTCEGLPLAIVALGGLMGSKDRSELKWREVYDSLSWHISNNKLLDEVKTVMLMSFNDLPYYLKNCFLYCCRFPMKEWIGAGRLIRMWMAEGFLEEKSSLNPEEVGKIYLKELISRNLLQVVKHQSFIRPKVCKLHDLMWELARSISERENFLSICSAEELEKDEIRARRLSVQNVDGTFKMNGNLTHVRSFSMFNFKGEKSLLDDLLSRFRLLRVLELNDAKVDSLPNELGKLFNLRYLSLCGTGIKELPMSVNRLRKLQTLDIRRTEVNSLPNGITELHNLRHLLAYGKKIAADHFAYFKGVKVPGKLWKLKNLQVLNCIEANGDIARKIRKMAKLRRIELTCVKEEYMKDLCSSIDKLKFLHHILLMAVDENEILKLDGVSETRSNIFRKVTLVGKLNNVPRWFSSMLNVMHLHLHWSQLPEDQDFIPCISQLPSLEHLVLVNAYSSKKQLLFISGFQKLEDLQVSCSLELEEMVFLEGVMPNLMRLHIHDCPKLKEVPQGLEHLTNLELMNLKAASSELVESIRSKESSSRSKVRRIPSIKHYYEADGVHAYESLSLDFVS